METYKSIAYLFNQTTEAESFGGGKKNTGGIYKHSTNKVHHIWYPKKKREGKEL